MILFQSILDTYLLAALIPPLFLLVYVYKQDKIEKEPPGLIIKLFLMGALSVIGAMVLEWVGQSLILPAIFGNDASSFAYRLCLYFVVVACSEEFVKYRMLRRGSWYDYNFNYRFDGIVYAVAVGLGFAAAENIEYVFMYGMSTAVVRALTAIPGHCIFAVYMGYYYGMAKYHQRRYHKGLQKFYAFLSYAVPVVMHGTYDFCATYPTAEGQGAFYIYIIILDIIAFISVKRFSKKDTML